MGVWIGSARSSFGNMNPGDQNGGREVSKQKYYVHRSPYILFKIYTNIIDFFLKL